MNLSEQLDSWLGGTDRNTSKRRRGGLEIAADASQFQYPNVAGIAVIDDGLIVCGENEALDAGRSNQEAVGGVPGRLSRQESVLGR